MEHRLLQNGCYKAQGHVSVPSKAKITVPKTAISLDSFKVLFFITLPFFPLFHIQS